MTSTGYFGVPGKLGGRVHVVQGGKPVCGARVRGEFQWCAHGIQMDYVDCSRCRDSKVVKEYQEEAHRAFMRRIYGKWLPTRG